MSNVKIIAIPVRGNSSEFKVSKLFARSPYFVIYDEKSKSKTLIANKFKDEHSQSGKSIAKLLVARGVNTFCGFEIGYNVQKIAEENNIQLIILKEEESTTGSKIIDLISRK
ncbi:MAG: NifB/NifX family molybdenum-iron cluster-binding protein [Bacteroidota bacterium]